MLKMVQNQGKKLGGWRTERGDEYIPKCVRSRRAPKDTLDGSPISVVDEDIDGSGSEKVMLVNKTEVSMPRCALGIKFQIISWKGSGLLHSIKSTIY